MTMQEIVPNQSITRKKELTLRFAVVTTFVSLLPTAFFALNSNSLILLADFLRCFVEFGAILASWLIIRKVAKGNSDYFDYGFGKLEQFASLAVAAALFISCIAIILLSIHRFYHPEPVENVILGLIFAVLSVIGNAALWLYNKNLAQKEYSPILVSQWRLFRAKAFSAVVVAISLFLAWSAVKSPYLIYADPIGSLILAGFLLHSAIMLISSSMYDLIDRSVDEAVRLVIVSVLVKHESLYKGLLFLRTRCAANKIYIEIGLEFAGEDSFSDVHKAMQQIRIDLYGEIKNCEVNILPELGHLSMLPSRQAVPNTRG